MSGGGGEDDDSDKQHEPSQKKLDDARRKGEVPRSADLTTAAGYAGVLLVAAALGAASLKDLGATLAGVMARAHLLAPEVVLGGGGALTATLATEIGLALAPWMAIPLAFALVSVLGQQALLFTGSKLAPKMSRVSIMGNAKNKFGKNGLFEFAKSFVKLAIYSVALSMFLWARLPEILSLATMDPGLATARALEMCVTFLALVLAIALALGFVDLVWQRAEHINKHRMSRKEMTDEHKESEGDPHMKQQRRQKGMEIASNRMMADVPDASVVIVNPTHYAIALKWSRSSPGAPVCVAKGTDMVAARIRETATQAGVPIHSDPPTARALHATVRVGEEIRADQYAAVAVAIRFAEAMRKKARFR